MIDWSKPNNTARGQVVAVPVAKRPDRFDTIADVTRSAKDDKMYCLMLLLLALCGAGILVCVLVAGIIYASQSGGA